MPVKPLTFKGDKKLSKKRKATTAFDYSTTNTTTDHISPSPHPPPSTSLAITTTTTTTTTTTVQDEDTWVTADIPTDLSGPTLLVLPTHPTPTALACDDSGAVFASPLENLIEGDPATAEPHQVAQVWVATQIPGAQSGEVVCSFRGVNGRYLGYGGRDNGGLRAEAVAVGVGEGWVVRRAGAEEEEGERGRSRLVLGSRVERDETEEGKKEKEKLGFLHVEEGGRQRWEVRGDGEGITEMSLLRIRMQARFKPRLKADKEQKAKEKISRRELEAAVGRKLEDDEVKRLKRARRDGTYHEEVLDVRVKGKHDKFAS